jgi:hypothetical protein
LLDGGMDGLETHCAIGQKLIVNQASSDQPQHSVKEPNKQRGVKETRKLVPMRVSGTDIDLCQDIMGLPKEFIASPSNDKRRAQDKESQYQQSGDNAPNHVCLSNQLHSSLGLGRVKLCLNNNPGYCMEQCLH